MMSRNESGMQQRKGLINGGPNKKAELDIDEAHRNIDKMTYIAFAGAGIFLGALIALYLVGGI
jgi:hypothetical protein